MLWLIPWILDPKHIHVAFLSGANIFGTYLFAFASYNLNGVEPLTSTR